MARASASAVLECCSQTTCLHYVVEECVCVCDSNALTNTPNKDACPQQSAMHASAHTEHCRRCISVACMPALDLCKPFTVMICASHHHGHHDVCKPSTCSGLVQAITTLLARTSHDHDACKYACKLPSVRLQAMYTNHMVACSNTHMHARTQCSLHCLLRYLSSIKHDRNQLAPKEVKHSQCEHASLRVIGRKVMPSKCMDVRSWYVPVTHTYIGPTGINKLHTCGGAAGNIGAGGRDGAVGEGP
eukprot:1160142-Pelagomonas_calceolata.AAC.25